MVIIYNIYYKKTYNYKIYFKHIYTKKIDMSIQMKIKTIKLRNTFPKRFPSRRPRVYTSLAPKPRARVGSSFKEIASQEQEGKFQKTA